MEKRKSIVIQAVLFLIMGFCFLLMMGCGRADSNTAREFLGERNGNVITWYADVTQDDKDNRIIVDLEGILTDKQIPAKVQVYGQEENLLWTGEVGIPHMGWGYYYLVNDKNKDYILFYLPDESQGDIYYTLLVFHFDSEGNQILDENYKISYESDKQWERDLQKFNKLLNKYLENSVLLVSTFEFQLEYDIPKSQAAEDGVDTVGNSVYIDSNSSENGERVLNEASVEADEDIQTDGAGMDIVGGSSYIDPDELGTEGERSLSESPLD